MWCRRQKGIVYAGESSHLYEERSCTNTLQSYAGSFKIVSVFVPIHILAFSTPVLRGFDTELARVVLNRRRYLKL